MRMEDVMLESICNPDCTPLFETALELANDDEALARRLLHMIVETNRSTLDSLRACVAADDWAGVGSAAHHIAGSARMLGRYGLLAALIHLEGTARQRDIPLLTIVLPRVVDAIEHLDRSIEETLGFDGGL